jgi:5'-nucleotidase
MSTTRLLAVLLSLVLVSSVAGAQPLRVLVTNDDGVGAAGIDALVTALAANPNLALTVIAPAANQSGTGDQVTGASGTIDVTSSTTAGGFPALAVTGFPADTVVFGIVESLAATPPELVVSGINDGQNIGDLVALSGTVGAALWAARLGVPAFAVSAQIATGDFVAAAQFTATLVERFRTSGGFRKRMVDRKPPFKGLVLNLNFPSCPGGPRGLKLLPVGRQTAFVDYTLQADVGGVQTWKPVTQTTGPFGVNCASTLEDPATDLEAFTNGFATVSPIGAERSITTRSISRFRFVPELF